MAWHGMAKASAIGILQDKACKHVQIIMPYPPYYSFDIGKREQRIIDLQALPPAISLNPHATYYILFLRYVAVI